MITVFQTTRPRFTDTKWITQQKLLQCQRDGPTAGSLDKIAEFLNTSPHDSDSELASLQKQLQLCN